MRLVGGGSNEGRVEICLFERQIIRSRTYCTSRYRYTGNCYSYGREYYYDYDYNWGTVCGQGYTWDSSDAKVVCRELGLPTDSEFQNIQVTS